MINSDENVEFNLGEDEQPATVTITEEDGETKSVVESGPNAEELDQYSEKVKKRIDKLTARLRETERREQSAIEYAKSVQSRNEELQKRYEQTAVERVGEAKGRIETQITALKNVIRRAREEGDIDTETEASQRLTATIMEQQQLANHEAQVRRIQQQGTSQQQMRAPQPPIQPAPRVDIKAEEWAENNPWFGSDVVMTNAVRGIHVELVKNEGFDPRTDEYYDEIDRRMQELFPRKFSESAPQTSRSSRPVQTVASATRSSGVNSSARRSIRLKPSEVAMAKKLGVPLEKYAQYVKR